MSWDRHIRVQPEALDKAAGEAETIGDSLGKRIDFARPECASATSHAGFRTAGALDGCVATWEDNVRRTADEISGVGGKLADCARTYTGTDEHAAGRMRFF